MNVRSSLVRKIRPARMSTWGKNALLAGLQFEQIAAPFTLLNESFTSLSATHHLGWADELPVLQSWTRWTSVRSPCQKCGCQLWIARMVAGERAARDKHNSDKLSGRSPHAAFRLGLRRGATGQRRAPRLTAVQFHRFPQSSLCGQSPYDSPTIPSEGMCENLGFGEDFMSTAAHNSRPKNEPPRFANCVRS